jgi:Winged helix-turn helix
MTNLDEQGRPERPLAGDETATLLGFLEYQRDPGVEVQATGCGGQRAELEGLARSHTAPAREVRQAKALLWATDGVSNAEIARRCASTPKSVRRWRSRFAAEGTAAVGRIRAGRGRPVVLGDGVVEAIVHDTLHTVPEDGSACWSTRSMAARYGIGKDTVARIWQARRIRPWKVETFKLSTDPSFESKLRDVVGLYVNPPAATANSAPAG